MRNTRFIALGVAASLGLGAGGVAIAQTNTDPGHTLDVVVPKKAGKKKKPKNVSVGLEIQNNKDSKTTASRIEVLFPKNVKFNLKGFPVCSEETLDPSAGTGPSDCDPKANLGEGKASAVLNPRGASPQPLNFKNTFFVGGRKQLNIYLEQTDGEIRKLLIGKIGKAGGKYGEKLTIDIPGDLQQPLPGTFSALTDITTTLKGKTVGKGKKKHGALQSVGCKGGRYEFRTRLTYVPNPDKPARDKSEADDAVPCSK